ncbi:bifunctional DNA-formamidopyrimidine glycosylase/DNA-(apurinic or apyrimidinic site) lyase [soil metagenome]
MPELPEVEHVKRQLGALIGIPRRVESIEFFRKDLRFPIPMKLKLKLAGNDVIAIERRAKYLLFKFAHGWMLSHLGMTGAWREIGQNENAILHDHVRMNFADGFSLIFNDPRRFGFIDWVDDIERHPRLDHLGPEPLEPGFTGEQLFRKLRKRTAAIKTLIMDQRIVVGVGNIYASEALFRAGLRPTRPAGRVTLAECERLVHEIKIILQAAIESGGSTIRTYRSADGSQGSFQSRFFVYERDGQACLKCNGTNVKSVLIQSRMIAARSTYWCSRCQK